MKETLKKVAVIGAGAAGLTATKRLTEAGSGFECCTFEQTNGVGGTWVYTDKVGQDEQGLPVHSSMYQGLRTNLPKQIMELPDFPHPHQTKKSYVTSQDVLNYFEEYADHFNLRKFIKFRHHVNMVEPLDNNQWKIQVTDLKRQKNHVYYFDAVIVCIGNYSNPVYPKIDGIENFKGIQLHSHDYKNPSMFQNMNVAVIGAGSSGLDISNQISKVAKKVYLSHHNEKIRQIEFPENLIQTADVSKATPHSLKFIDRTEFDVDAIVYCTGYEYKYSFLSSKCNISVQNMVVKPLYKHFINIEHPTMCIIGIPRDCPGFTLFDLQVRCFINILNNKVTLLNKNKMYDETEIDMKEKQEITGQQKYYHIMNKHAQKYFDSLSELGKLPTTRQVVFDVYFHGLERMVKDFKNFRTKTYKLIDDDRFEVSE